MRGNSIMINFYKKNGEKYSSCEESTRYKNILVEDLDRIGKITQSIQKCPGSLALPELYKFKKNCCGCSACYSICPTSAISMELDNEGFFYPVVDAIKCIRCYKCLDVCIFKINQKEKKFFL